MKITSFWLKVICLQYVSQVFASRTISPSVCSEALLEAYSEVAFAGPGYGDYYGSFCLNELKIASFLSSERVYCSTSTLNQAVTYAEDFCHDNSFVDGVNTLMQQVASTITQEYVASLPTYERDHFTPIENVTKPFLISGSWFDIVYRTVDDFDHQTWRDRTNGWALYGFWGVLVALGTARNLTTSWQESRHSVETFDVEALEKQRRLENTTPSHLQAVTRIFMQHVCVPKLFHSGSLLGCTNPTRLEALVLFMFWALSITLCSVDYRGFSGNVYWPTISQQTVRYIADRTGVMALANLPILWLFSGRNNVLIWATGWSFETFNTFHRHIARAATLQAVVHGATFTVNYLTGEGGFAEYSTDWKSSWFYMGVVSAISMGILVGSSIPWFRQHRYETFLIIHIALSVVLIVGLSYHLSIFGTEFTPYLWPLVAVWCFDRVIRVARLAYCNVNIQLKSQRAVRCTQSTVHYDAKADILRIRLRVSNLLARPGPGQHFFLYEPFRWKGWESHPFTLAYWEQPATADTVCTTASLQCYTGITERDKMTPSPSESISTTTKEAGDRAGLAQHVPTYEFWVRPKDGWTRKLRDRCLGRPDRRCSPFILLEGPYGNRKPLSRYDKVLFIAGGSGIAVMVPYIVERAGRTAGARLMYSELIWVNKDKEYMESVMRSSLTDALGSESVEASLFSTGPEGITTANECRVKPEELGLQDGDAQNAAGKETIIEKQTVVGGERGRSRVAICVGRPDIRAEVWRAAKEAHESQQSLAVVASGPDSLTNECREAVTLVMGESALISVLNYYEPSVESIAENDHQSAECLFELVFGAITEKSDVPASQAVVAAAELGYSASHMIVLAEPHRADALDGRALQNAQERIQWLEEIVSAELNTDCKSIPTGTPLVKPQSNNVGAPFGRRQGENHHRQPATKRLSVSAFSSSQPVDPGDDSEIGLLASPATGDYKNLGPASKAFFINYATALVRACGMGYLNSGNTAQHDISNSKASQQQCILKPEEVDLLLKSYELWIHPLYPLFEPDHLRRLIARYSKQQGRLENRDSENAVSDTPTEVTIFYLVMALGAVNLGSTIRHLEPDARHSTVVQIPKDTILTVSLAHVDQILASQPRPSISLIRLILLVCIYSSYGPTGYSQWQLSGLAMRTATEIGLHHDAPQRQQDPSGRFEKDVVSRIFWTAYTVEITLAYNLKKPPSISEQHITALLPDCISDGGSNSDYSIHHIKHRRIQARILERVYGGMSRLDSPAADQREGTIAELQTTLDEWWEGVLAQFIASGDSPGFITPPYPKRYWDRLYHGTCFVLHRASPLCPQPTVSSLERCMRSAGAYVDDVTECLRGSHVPVSWMLVQGVLFAGLTMLATARTSFRCLAAHAGVELLLVELPTCIRKCSVSLAVMVERMGDSLVAKLDSQFEVLANSTLALVSTELTKRLGQAREEQQQYDLEADIGGDRPPIGVDQGLEIPDDGFEFDWGNLDSFRELLEAGDSDSPWGPLNAAS